MPSSVINRYSACSFLPCVQSLFVLQDFWLSTRMDASLAPISNATRLIRAARAKGKQQTPFSRERYGSWRLTLPHSLASLFPSIQHPSSLPLSWSKPEAVSRVFDTFLTWLSVKTVECREGVQCFVQQKSIVFYASAGFFTSNWRFLQVPIAFEFVEQNVSFYSYSTLIFV